MNPSGRAVRLLAPAVVTLLAAGGTAAAFEPSATDATRVQVGQGAELPSTPLSLAPTPETGAPSIPEAPMATSTPTVPPLPPVPSVPAVTVPRLPLLTPAPVRRSDRLESNGTYLADGDGGGLVRIGAGVDFVAPRLSPDGRRLAFFRNDRVWVANADGSDATAVSGGDRACCHLDWSPDGGEIAYEAAPRGQGTRILAVSPDGRNNRVLLENGAAPAWSPAGGRLMFMSGPPELWLSVREADGTVHRILRGIRTGPAWSPDGRQLLASGTDPETGEQATWVFEADGSGRRRIDAAGDRSRQYLSWSPDGAYITWGVDGRAGAEPQRIWIARPDGSSVRDLGTGYLSPVWAPQVQKLVLQNGHRAETMNPDGSGRRPFLELSSTSASYGVGRFSADGRRVIIGAW